MKTDFTVCALLYGDYPELAERCLRPLVTAWDDADLELRLATNAISQRTLALLQEEDFFPLWDQHCWHSSENRFKYPAMRTVLQGRPIESEFVMWFDDDSYIRAENPASWFGRVKVAMQDADMVGSVYQMRLGGQQARWIKAQPWYTGKPIADRHSVRFATGGWWCIRSEILRRFDWPLPQLQHRGGDVMLGELCRQQDLRLRHFNRDVAINADTQGRESKAPRRGHDELPVGWKG